MTDSLGERCWPLARAGEALEALARAAGLVSASAAVLPAIPRAIERAGGRAFETWLIDAAACCGLETEWLALRYADVADVLRDAAPILLNVSTPGGSALLAIVRSRAGRLDVLAPDLTIHALEAGLARAHLCAPAERRAAVVVDRLIAAAGIAGDRRARAALLRDRIANEHIADGWMLRREPGASPSKVAQGAGLHRRVVTLVAAHAGAYALLILAWWLVGKGALTGQLSAGWLAGWALALASGAALSVLVSWTGGRFALDAGALLKQRLLAGALRLEPETVRLQGAGELLGRVIESETVESLALTGGLVALTAVVELLAAAVVLGLGSGGAIHVLALVAWFALTLALGARYQRRLGRWTDVRLAMTHALVERMAGHTTRLVQERPERWHDGEDQQLEAYLARAQQLDHAGTLIATAVPRGWLLIAILCLAPALLSVRTSPGPMAVAVGGILLAFGAFRRLVSGLPQIAAAMTAWQHLSPLFRAATRVEPLAAATLALDAGRAVSVEGSTVVEGHDLVFRYRASAPAVLAGCDLVIKVGERILLEGPSGGGKSTLGALIAGLRRPESGLLLFRGLDHHSLGSERWRRRIAAAPQFHENYVLTGTFAFNLLMGPRWPPRAHDLEEAEAVCRELGLGPLLDRMPAGLLQTVGEMGWQLSHGERSRLYIARALLQGAEMLVLDESFAALDPETMQQCMECVFRRARTVLVIAHP